MKREKLFACIGVVILILSCACGCSQKQEKCGAYTVLKPGTPEADAIWKKQSARTEETPEDATVIVNGVEYTAKYSVAGFGIPDEYNLNYIYRGEDCYIQIDAKTGQLRNLYVFNKDPLAYDVPADPAYCRQLADKIVGHYIALNKYQVRELQCCYCKLAHNYEYYKTVNGYKVTDGAEISFICNGKFHNLKLYMPRSFDNVKSVEIDEGKLKEVLEAKVREMTPTGHELLKWKEKDSQLIRLENGQYALYVLISAYYKNDSSETPREEYTRLIVILEHTKKNPFKP